jgi:4-hydroxy-4-methyl-2-oxoglutarate aldolase
MTTADQLIALGAATLGESGGEPMAPRIKPVWSGATVAGPAFAVACGEADNLAIHVAVAEAPAGSVLVADASRPPERGYWGEVLTTGAEARGLAGLIIDGGVRDVAAIEAHQFPIFSSTVALQGAVKVAGGSVGGSTNVGGVTVRTGDWVVGDADGVVVIRADRLDEVVAAGTARATKEERLFKALREGATTIELLGLDPAPIKHEGG